MLAIRSTAALRRAGSRHQNVCLAVRLFSDVQEYVPAPRGPRQPRPSSSPSPTSNQSSRYSDSSQGLAPSGRSQQQSNRPTLPIVPLSGLVSKRPVTPPHLLTLADLSPQQISNLLRTALAFKILSRPGVKATTRSGSAIRQSLTGHMTALIFSKRSTRTRVASETAMNALGGGAMFLGRDDIQLGVNETLEDSAKVIGSMADGIMARVGAHAEVEVGRHWSLACIASTDASLFR